jgi:hypothetical protein
MSGKRGHNGGTGFPRESGRVVAGSINTQNARPDLDTILFNRSNQTPLWERQNIEDGLATIAQEGELAFHLKSWVSSTSATYAKRSEVFGGSSTGTFDDTTTSVRYLSFMNGVGSRSEMSLFGGDLQKTQLSYRNRIQYIGIVNHTVDKEHNLYDQGNTLIVSKGTSTIINTGTEQIFQGQDISWDVPLTDLYDQSGLSRYGNFEPRRFSLFTVPTKSIDSSVEHATRLYKEDFRNGAHEEFSKKFWKGMMTIGGLLALQIASYNNPYPLTSGSASKTLSKSEYVADQATTDIYANPPGTVPIFTTTNEAALAMIRIGIDEDDISGWQGFDVHFPATRFGFNHPSIKKILTDNDSRLRLEEHIALVKKDGDKSFVVKQYGADDILSKMLDYGLYNVVVGCNGLIQGDIDRRIGKAVSDAAPGYKFDLIL